MTHDYVLLRYTMIDGKPLVPPRWVIATERGVRSIGGDGLALGETRRFDRKWIYGGISHQPINNVVDVWRVNDLPKDIFAAYLAWRSKYDRIEVT